MMRLRTFRVGDPGLQGLFEFLDVHSWGQSDVKSDHELGWNNVGLDAAIDLGQVERCHVAELEARTLTMQAAEKKSNFYSQC